MIFSIFGLDSYESIKLDEIQAAFLQTRKTEVLNDTQSMEFSNWEQFKQNVFTKLICWNMNVESDLHEEVFTHNEMEEEIQAEISTIAGTLANEFIRWRERISSTRYDVNCGKLSENLSLNGSNVSDLQDKSNEAVHSLRPSYRHVYPKCVRETKLEGLDEFHVSSPHDMCEKSRSKLNFEL